MPELPEVETIVRDLNRVVVGRQFKAVKVKYTKQFRGNPREVVGTKLQNVERVGKMLVLHLSHGKDLVIHLKMTGQLIFLEKNHNPNSNILNLKSMTRSVIGGHPDRAYASLPPHQHTHITFEFTDGSHLYFNDLRVFGWMTLVKSGDRQLMEKIGIDALDKKLTPQYLSQICQKRKTTIKQLLMDQNVIGGIGNIYADEILFCARVQPETKSNQLTAVQIKKITTCIPQILERSIKAGGTSRSDYRKLDGSKGGYMDIAWVYGRENQPCRVCRTPIKRIKIGQRSSHFCPKCQKPNGNPKLKILL